MRPNTDVSAKRSWLDWDDELDAALSGLARAKKPFDLWQVSGYLSTMNWNLGLLLSSALLLSRAAVGF